MKPNIVVCVWLGVCLILYSVALSHTTRAEGIQAANTETDNTVSNVKGNRYRRDVRPSFNVFYHGARGPQFNTFNRGSYQKKADLNTYDRRMIKRNMGHYNVFYRGLDKKPAPFPGSYDASKRSFNVFYRGFNPKREWPVLSNQEDLDEYPTSYAKRSQPFNVFYHGMRTAPYNVFHRGQRTAPYNVFYRGLNPEKRFAPWNVFTRQPFIKKQNSRQMCDENEIEGESCGLLPLRCCGELVCQKLNPFTRKLDACPPGASHEDCQCFPIDWEPDEEEDVGRDNDI